MKKKWYFFGKEHENCVSIHSVRDHMEDDGITEMQVYEAKMATKCGHFYCDKYQEIGEVGEDCGRTCSSYVPNNGKSGRCKHYRNPYELGKLITVKL